MTKKREFLSQQLADDDRWLCESADYDLLAKYQHYNNLLFDGDLPIIPLAWRKLKGIGGKALAKIEIDPTKPRPNPVMVRVGQQDKLSNYIVTPGTLAIIISTIYQRSERALDMILIHEMIHVWLYTHGYLGESHGPKFKEQLRRCSRTVGFEVPLKDSVEGLELSDQITVKPLGVVLVETTTGFLYCIMTETALQDGLETLRGRLAYRVSINQQVSFYIIADERWTKQAMQVSVQRTVGRSFRYYKGSDATLVADLKANGTLIERLERQEEISS